MGSGKIEALLCDLGVTEDGTTLLRRLTEDAQCYMMNDMSERLLLTYLSHDGLRWVFEEMVGQLGGKVPIVLGKEKSNNILFLHTRCV